MIIDVVKLSVDYVVCANKPPDNIIPFSQQSICYSHVGILLTHLLK